MISVFRADGLPLVHDVEWARGYRRRAFGLIGFAALGANRGLIIAPCRAIHTFGMRFALDVVFFARNGRVIRIVSGIKPFRLAWGNRPAWGVLEMQSGWFPRNLLAEGDYLSFKGNEPLPAMAPCSNRMGANP